MLRQRCDISPDSWLALPKPSIIGLLYVNVQIVMSMLSFVRSAFVTKALKGEKLVPFLPNTERQERQKMAEDAKRMVWILEPPVQAF